MMYSMDHLKQLGKLDGAANGAWAKFREFDDAAMAEGAIPAKYKELIALSVAMTTQCAYCLEIHGKRARKLGVTDEELAEAALVTANVRAGGAFTHGMHVLSDD